MEAKPILLSAEQTQILNAEKVFFQNLLPVAEAFGAAPEERELLVKVSSGLDELFLLVIVGEFNSGKSSFINALLGAKVLTEGVTPTTSQINVLHYAPQPDQRHSQQERELLEIFYPAQFLQEISIVDTPGTNAVIERHQALTEDFVPRSDLVIFVTSAERPFTQSERLFLEKVSNWGKKIVVVINKIDLLTNAHDHQQVIQFVADGFRQLLDLQPPIFSVSSRLALYAKTQDGNWWPQSGFGPLENYIFGTLDQVSRIRLKLTNPLTVAERLIGRYQSVITQRLLLLEQDSRRVDNIERQLAIYQSDLHRDFEGRLDRVNNLLYELNERADHFFDDVLKVTRAFDLIKTDRIKRDFEERVVADTPHRIEQAIQEMVEWIVEREGRVWHDVSEYLREQRQLTTQSQTEQQQLFMIGAEGSGNDYDRFYSNRRELLTQVGERTRAVMQSFDERAEGEKLNLAVRSALTSTALTEIGAVGLGAALAILISTAAADVTGLLLTIVMGGVGLYIIPARRRRAKYEFRHKLETLRGQLSSILKEQFQHELTLSTERVREALAPYTRFIQTEQVRLSQLNEQFDGLGQEMKRLYQAIETNMPDRTNLVYPANPATQSMQLPNAAATPAQIETESSLYPPANYDYL